MRIYYDIDLMERPPMAGRRKPTPFFLETSRAERRRIWTSVLANCAVIAGGCGYLLWFAPSMALPLLWMPAILLGGLFLGDFASGLLHWAMDTWFDEATLGRAVLIAREHHSHPHHILGYGFLESAALGSAPSAALFGPMMVSTAVAGAGPLSYGLMMLWTILAACMLFATSFHNLGHHYARARSLRWLQRIGLLMTPVYHGVHHRPPQMVRYCVITGWANPVCDRLGVWRVLERIIGALTGAEPRRDNVAWRRLWKDRVCDSPARSGREA